MQLPLKLNMDLMQTRWKSLLDPILENPANNISFLKDIELALGSNQITHKLGKLPQGWFLTNIQSAAHIYSDGFNATTINLVCLPAFIFFSGDTVNGSPIISNISSSQTVFLQEGQLVNAIVGVPTPAIARIIKVESTQITLNVNATASTTATPFQAQQSGVNINLGVF